MRSVRYLFILAVVLGLTSALATAAQADPGVVGYLPGAENGVAVNATGAGGASVGDIYTGGGGLNQYSSSGQLLRRWGSDTVLSGPDNADELQQILIKATGGTFTLSFAGNTTAPLAFGAPPNGAGSVQAALNGLPSISAAGTVTVTGGPGDATGSSPYLVSFDGGALAGVDQPQIVVNDASLIGGPAAGWGTTVNPGDVGFEVCAPSEGDTCKSSIGIGLSSQSYINGGLGGGPTGIAVDQGSGDVYVATESARRIVKFSATGKFLRAFGFDVVASGPHDSNADAQYSITVKATGGTYTLTVGAPCCGLGTNKQFTTNEISWNAPANGPGSVEEALNKTLAPFGGTVDVTGGPGNASGSTPYTVTFGGRFSGDSPSPEFSLGSSTSNLLGSGKAVTISPEGGGALEVCVNPMDSCKVGGGTGSVSPYLISPSNVDENRISLAVAPSGAPNAGNVLLVDSGRQLVQEFTGDGEFVRIFGFGVVHGGATGSGNITANSNIVTSVATNSKAFLAGQPISSGGSEIPPGTVITALGAGTITLSRVATATAAAASLDVPAGAGNASTNERQTVQLGAGVTSGNFKLTFSTPNPSNSSQTTANIPYNATVAQVQTALQSLTNIGGAANVSVSLNPGGNPGGGAAPGGPWTVEFIGKYADTNVNLLVRAEGTPNLNTNTGFSIATPQEGASTFEVCTTVPGCQLGASGSAIGSFNSLSGIAEDSEGNVYTVEGPGGNRRVQKFTPPVAYDPAVLTPSEFGGPGAPTGTSNSNAPVAIAIGPSDEVFVAKRFLAAATPCLDLSSSPAESRIQEYASDGLTIAETSLPCMIDNTAPIPNKTINNVVLNGLTVNAVTGSPYLLDKPSGGGAQGRAYVFGNQGTAPGLSLDEPTELSSSGVVISGEVNPNGPEPGGYPNPIKTAYKVEYKKAADASWTAYSPETPIGSGSLPLPFSIGVSGLFPATEYLIKVTAIKQFGFPLVSEVATITTPSGRPRVDSAYSEHVTANSADLHALVNPAGAETTYRFEYGTTPEYGESTPPVSLGHGVAAVPVEAHLEGLTPSVYHFRVIATNSEGSAATPDQVFNFYPQICPNETARQQTGTQRLPDCRAYELVSPGRAGSITLQTRGPSSSSATNPSRFGFGGYLGTLPGPWNASNYFGDAYVATRASTGWETSYVGIEAHEAEPTANPGRETGLSIAGSGNLYLTSDESLSHFLQWGLNSAGTGRSSAPYLFDSKNDRLGRLPTNLDEIPGGDVAPTSGGFVGDQLLSPDGTSFFYSSANVPLASGGLSSGAGSVYVNNIESGVVSVVSKTEAGTDIPPAPGPFNSGHFLRLAGSSRDGSHLLIMAPAACSSSTSLSSPCPTSPAVLYINVDASHSYDVSKGVPVTYQGMTADGSLVFFTTAEQIPGTEDNDTGADLFMWRESDNSLTRLSDGPGSLGNTDACLATWIANCGVQVVPRAAPGVGSNDPLYSPVSDNPVSSVSGSVYFFSPEQFVGADGIPGRRNLYVSREGQIHYLATFEDGKSISRIQVSPDGRFAAFVTTSRLTQYDNAGFAEMYRYDDASGDLFCLSCIPSGEPPTVGVRASLNGVFMTDDGRPFFSTSDPLVPADTDGIADVYEYVDGRALLITTGSASIDPDDRDSQLGLVGVSADGTDVYFSTLESLVPADENGPFLKFYDARTGGGFPSSPEVAPCEAADECHSQGAPPPPVQRLGTTGDLGDGGNAGQIKRKKRCSPKRHGVKASNHRKGSCGDQGRGKRHHRRSDHHHGGRK